MSTKQKSQIDILTEREKAIDEAIKQLEGEGQELQNAGALPSWDDLQAGGGEADLLRLEGRKSLIPRLIASAKIKRLEIRCEKYEQMLSPLRVENERAYSDLEAATHRRVQAEEEEREARAKFGHVFSEIQRLEERTRSLRREIGQLRGER